MNSVERNPLSFSQNGEFKIMVWGDPHEKLKYDERTVDRERMIYAALDKCNPDLVVIMGDLASGSVYTENGRRDATPEEIGIQLDRLTKPLRDRGIPFTTVYGNHDEETKVTKAEKTVMLKKHPNCILENTPGTSGEGNFNIPIKSSDGSRVALNLWLIDSHNRYIDGLYDHVKQDQIDWYEKTAAKLKKQNGGVPVPAIVFQHIPVREEYELFKRVSLLAYNKVRGYEGYDSAHFYYVDEKKAKGYAGEGPCVAGYNSGQFDSWKRTGDVFAAFFGHDHLNDFIGKVDGITLGQCRAIGFHIFGDGMRQGVRMITLNENNPRDFKTEMLLYRQLVGNDCLSLQKFDKWFTDRQRINGKSGLIALGCAGIALAGIGAVKLIKKK